MSFSSSTRDDDETIDDYMDNWLLFSGVAC